MGAAGARIGEDDRVHIDEWQLAQRRGQRKDQSVTRSRRLTDQQRELCRAYFNEARFVMSEACRIAGYAPSICKTPGVIFARPQVVQELERLARENRRRYEVTYDKLVDELANIAFFNLADVMEFDEETGEFVAFNLTNKNMRALAALGEVNIETVYEKTDTGPQAIRKIKIKPHNKLASLEALMKHMGLSKEKKVVEHNVSFEDRLSAGRDRIRAGDDARVIEGQHEVVEETIGDLL